MIRIVLEYALPLVLPAVIYAGWVWYARATHQGEGVPPALRKGPLFWCVLAGFALMVATLVTVALSTGAPPDSTYQPPHLEDGRVVPPQYKN